MAENTPAALYQQRPDLYALPGHLARRSPLNPPSPLISEGGYVCTPKGWGKVIKITRSAVIVSVFALREDPGRQDFPEWELANRFERLAATMALAGYDVHDGRCEPSGQDRRLR